MAPKKLPPKGGTTANKPRAVTQRTATAVRQRVQQDTATLRALLDNMRRNAERNARQIPADPSPSVRRVGPGGANPKPQNRLTPGAKPPQLPPGNRGGAITPKGTGAITKPNSPAKPKALPPGAKGGAVATQGTKPAQTQGTGTRGGALDKPKGGPVRSVAVRDLGNTKALSPAKPAAKPPAKPAAKPANPWGSGTRPPATPYNGPRGTALPGGKPAPKPNTAATGAIGNAAKGLTGLKGGLANMIIAAIGGPIVDQLGQAGGRAIGNALVPVGRRVDDMLPGINSKDEANRRAKPQMTAAERAKAVRLTQAQPEQAKPKPRPQATAASPKPPRSTSSTTASSSSPRRSSNVSTPSKSGNTTPPGVPPLDSYRDGGKGLYQGSQAYRDSMKAKDANSSGNPMLDRNRKIGTTQSAIPGNSATSAPGGIGPTVSDKQLKDMKIRQDKAAERKRVRRRNEN